MAHGPLARLWLVGDMNWREEARCATASVTRNRRDAVRLAGRRLAWATHRCAKAPELGRPPSPLFMHRHGLTTLREYAEWAAPKSAIWGYWLLMQDGISVYGPNGEVEHIATPTASELARLRAQDARFGRMVDGMAAALRKSK